MSLFNLGGPGWFSDVFEVEITVDGDRMIDSHSLLFQEKCPLVGSDEMLCGKVKLTPPEGCSVWQDGVKLQLEWSVSFFETLATKESTAVEIALVEPGYVSEPTSYPFEIDLQSISSQFLETYDGEMFAIRHSILVTVTRPWYTFDVVRSLAIAVQKVNPAPAEEQHIIDDDAILRQRYVENPDEHHSQEGNEDGVADRKHRLRVVDASQGLLMEYEKSCLNLGESFQGVIFLGGGMPEFLMDKIEPENQVAQLKELEVVIYKIESGDGDSHEVIICTNTIDLASLKNGQESAPVVDASTPPAAPGTEQNATSEVDETEGDFVDPSVVLEFPVDIPLVKKENAIDFSPTIIDDKLSVRYFVRLVGKTAEDKSVWNTHEIVLFRNTLRAETI